MIVALLIVIAILLMPGGAPFLARVWGAGCVLVGLALSYVFWGTEFSWVMIAFGAVFAIAFVGSLVSGATRQRKRLFTGARPSSSEQVGTPPIGQTEVLTPNTTRLRRTPAPKRPLIPGDPFDAIVNGRIPKRALPELRELLRADGMVEAFKAVSLRVSARELAGAKIWEHPAGIYMVVPEVGAEELFTTLAGARDYHRKCIVQQRL